MPTFEYIRFPKKSDVKKILNKARIHINISDARRSFDDSYRHAHVGLKWLDAHGAQDCLSFQAQANTGSSRRDYNEYGDITRDDHGVITRCGFTDEINHDTGPFYAVKPDDTYRFSLTMVGYGSEDTGLYIVLREMVANVIKERNIRALYPRCELSQFIAALQALGAALDISEHVKIGNVSNGEFARRIRRLKEAA